MDYALINKRRLEFDIARGVAVFLMIFQHFWMLVLSYFFNTPKLDNLIYLSATALVAPVFLFLMGSSTVFSSKQKPKLIFIRGLKLIVLGYLLSFFRFFLPLVSLEKIGLIKVSEVIYHFEAIYYLLQIDIFHIAGLSLILLACLKKLKIEEKYYLVIALIIFIISPFLWQIKLVGFWQLLIDPFWGTSNYIVFPAFPWLTYSLLGFYFGKKLLENKDREESFYKFSLKKFKPILIISIFWLAIDIVVGKNTYANHGLGIGLFISSLIVCWLSFLYCNKGNIPSRMAKTLISWGKNVTAIYIWQWLIIAWLAILIRI